MPLVIKLTDRGAEVHHIDEVSSVDTLLSVHNLAAGNIVIENFAAHCVLPLVHPLQVKDNAECMKARQWCRFVGGSDPSQCFVSLPERNGSALGDGNETKH